MTIFNILHNIIRNIKNSLQEAKDYTDTKFGTAADYVVEESSSGIWIYRKWNSGIAECWGTDSSHSSASTAGQYANIQVAFPSSLFISKPVVVTSQGTNGTVQSYVGYSDVTGSSGNYTLDCWVYSANANKSINLFIQAIGKWK